MEEQTGLTGVLFHGETNRGGRFVVDVRQISMMERETEASDGWDGWRVFLKGQAGGVVTGHETGDWLYRVWLSFSRSGRL